MKINITVYMVHKGHRIKAQVYRKIKYKLEFLKQVSL